MAKIIYRVSMKQVQLERARERAELARERAELLAARAKIAAIRAARAERAYAAQRVDASLKTSSMGTGKTAALTFAGLPASA